MWYKYCVHDNLKPESFLFQLPVFMKIRTLRKEFSSSSLEVQRKSLRRQVEGGFVLISTSSYVETRGPASPNCCRFTDSITTSLGCPSSPVHISFQQYVNHLMPRGQYTSGKGSSAVGLTAYVTKDPETRQLVLQTSVVPSVGAVWPTVANCLLAIPQWSSCS